MIDLETYGITEEMHMLDLLTDTHMHQQSFWIITFKEVDMLVSYGRNTVDNTVVLYNVYPKVGEDLKKLSKCKYLREDLKKYLEEFNTSEFKINNVKNGILQYPLPTGR